MLNHNTHNSNSAEAGQASPFVILLMALGAVLVLATICTAGVLYFRPDDVANGISGTSTAIAQANATTLAQNALVTQTLSAIETEAARPTNTPTNTPVPPTNTPVPTNTPQPTNTPVLQEPAEATPTPNIFGTSIFSISTPTPIVGTGGGTDTGTGTGGGTLPETGIGTGTAIAAALGLFLLLITARRLRTD